MSGLNPNNARVVDPILTTHARGYRSAGRVGLTLFPRVLVTMRGGKILTFGKEAFQLYGTRRAPGTAAKRISFGYDGLPFALTQDAVEAPVPREFQQEAAAVPGIDLGQRAVNLVLDVQSLTLEAEQADIATNAANYDVNHKIALAGTDKWSADTGTPVTDINTGKEAVRQGIGLRPNTLVMGPEAWNAARSNPSVLAYFKLNDGTQVTQEQFKKLVEVDTLVVGESVIWDDTANKFVNIWGNCAVLAYVPSSVSGQEQPSYGYTYTLTNSPFVEAPYWENQSKSWIYGVTDDRAPVLTGMSAGFLIETPA